MNWVSIGSGNRFEIYVQQYTFRITNASPRVNELIQSSRVAKR